MQTHVASKTLHAAGTSKKRLISQIVPFVLIWLIYVFIAVHQKVHKRQLLADMRHTKAQIEALRAANTDMDLSRRHHQKQTIQRFYGSVGQQGFVSPYQKVPLKKVPLIELYKGP